LSTPRTDQGVPVGEVEPAHERVRVRDRHPGELGDADATHRDPEHDRLEALALAGGAGHLTHVLLDLLADVVRLGLGVPAQQRGDDPSTLAL
jgi:hypothetical protein